MSHDHPFKSSYYKFMLYMVYKLAAGESSGGLTNWLSLQCRGFGRVFIDRRSKCPLFPGAGEGRGYK